MHNYECTTLQISSLQKDQFLAVSTGVALAGKITSSEQLTTKYGRHYPTLK